MKLWVAVLFIISCMIFAEIPAGYYDSATGTGADLKTQLYNIIKGHTAKSYDSLWTHFQSTDKKANNKVWDMYSDIPNGTPPYEYTFTTDQCGNYSKEGDCYNREHSFPKSWFGGEVSPMNSDLFHLYPTDGFVNGKRDNYPFGEVTSPTWTSQNGSELGPCSYSGYTGAVFEPIDDYKGDFARTFFYMATRYEDVIASWEHNSTEGSDVLNGTTYPCYEEWVVNMLLKWHNDDPVSQKEIDRNNAVHSIQGNRNPFIDHPEWAVQIWGTPIDDTDAPVFSGIENISGNIKKKEIAISWSEANDDTPPIHYIIYRSLNSLDYDTNNPIDSTMSLSYIDTDLIVGNTYYYMVRARDSADPPNIDDNNAELYFYMYEESISSPLISIYPNPYRHEQGDFFIEMDEDIDNMEIYTVNGSIVYYSKTLNYDTASKRYVIDMPSVSSGVYFIVLYCKDSIAVKKISVLR